MAHRIALFASCALALTGLLTSCSDDEKAQAKARIWGNEKVPTALEKRSEETIAADALDGDPAVAERVLGMSFEEVVLRLGALRYEAEASIKIAGGKQKLSVTEKQMIEHGLNGDFRVTTKDGEDTLLREAVYHNGIFFVRNGAGAKMRVQGKVKDQHKVIRNEAWGPLATFTGYYGERLGWRKLGGDSVSSRSAIAYEPVLVDGPALIKNNAVDRPKKPLSIKGRLAVDAETGVVLSVKLTGKLEAPAQKEGAEPGLITFSLDQSLTQIEAKEMRPGEFVPTIKRHPTDLDPLAFMRGDVRTSTTIGGKKKKDPPSAVPLKKKPKLNVQPSKKPGAKKPASDAPAPTP